MKPKYYILWLMLTLCPAVSAQNRVTVKNIVYSTVSNLPAGQRELLGIREEPFFLNRTWASLWGRGIISIFIKSR